MANIELVNLSKQYQQGRNVVRALDGVSLRIEGGEFVSIVGRSGSGKTTLLDLVGLLMRPTTGTVLIDGTDTARLSDSRRSDLRGGRIGFVFPGIQPAALTQRAGERAAPPPLRRWPGS